MRYSSWRNPMLILLFRLRFQGARGRSISSKSFGGIKHIRSTGGGRLVDYFIIEFGLGY